MRLAGCKNAWLAVRRPQWQEVKASKAPKPGDLQLSSSKSESGPKRKLSTPLAPSHQRPGSSAKADARGASRWRHLHADATCQPASQPSTPSVRDTQRTRATTGFGSTQGEHPGSWGLESNAHGGLLRARLAKPTGAGGRKPRLVGTGRECFRKGPPQASFSLRCL